MRESQGKVRNFHKKDVHTQEPAIRLVCHGDRKISEQFLKPGVFVAIRPKINGWQKKGTLETSLVSSRRLIPPPRHKPHWEQVTVTGKGVLAKGAEVGHITTEWHEEVADLTAGQQDKESEMHKPGAPLGEKNRIEGIKQRKKVWGEQEPGPISRPRKKNRARKSPLKKESRLGNLKTSAAIGGGLFRRREKLEDG